MSIILWYMCSTFSLYIHRLMCIFTAFISWVFLTGQKTTHKNRVCLMQVYFLHQYTKKNSVSHASIFVYCIRIFCCLFEMGSHSVSCVGLLIAILCFNPLSCEMTRIRHCDQVKLFFMAVELIHF